MYNYRRAKFLIEQEFSLFPRATLSDIYKLFFQNCQGSGHFLPDLTAIKDYIIQEMSEVDLKEFHYPDYDTSYLFPVKRVSLVSIIIGKYDINYIADKFMELSLSPKILTVNEWKQEWNDIKKLTLRIKPHVFDDLTSSNIDLSMAVHHSDIYRINYKPHYRICSMS